MGNTHEALEHAEHVQHHAHDPFDRKVAMTMAIVAATLASVTLLSHREHNQTILQQAQATTLHTQASDAWNFYQAKNIRTHEYNAFAALIGSMAKESLQEDKAKKSRDFWEQKAKGYEEKDLPKLKKEAEELVRRAKEHEHLSHVSHERTYGFDGGELFIELALVLCSIAVLTKQRGFWLTGITLCTVGVCIALVALTPVWPRIVETVTGGHVGGHDAHAAPHTAPETPGKAHDTGHKPSH